MKFPGINFIKKLHHRSIKYHCLAGRRKSMYGSVSFTNKIKTDFTNKNKTKSDYELINFVLK